MIWPLKNVYFKQKISIARIINTKARRKKKKEKEKEKKKQTNNDPLELYDFVTPF